MMISITLKDETQVGALQKLAVERKVLGDFLVIHGLDSSTLAIEVENLAPHYDEVFVKETPRQVQNGFDTFQNVRVASKDLEKITLTNKALLQLRAENHPVKAHSSYYLVSNLEAVKMSLIADATKNVRSRTTEFVKQDGVKVGVMKSASQDAFYILPVGGDAGDDSYGGVYDKSTIDKIARVIVTIFYNIE